MFSIFRLRTSGTLPSYENLSMLVERFVGRRFRGLVFSRVYGKDVGAPLQCMLLFVVCSSMPESRQSADRNNDFLLERGRLTLIMIGVDLAIWCI